MKDQVVVVTGGGRGIGRTTALMFAAAGARVAVWDVDGSAAAQVAAEISASGGEAVAQQVDVTRRAAVQAAVQEVLAMWGQVDVLVNNAGITQDAQLGKMTEEQWDRVVDVNLKGVFNCAQAVAAPMAERGRGRILSASSVVGTCGNFGQTNYAATKAGIIGMTRTWAKELARKGITANAVAPGFIATEMTAAMPDKVLSLMREKTPVGRLGTPEDVAKAYLFLASDGADFITGQTLGVDGGLVL
ncbi:MAG: 3-oxoacyl-[acyl-carrier-protein] reductase [Candidatus Sericytochromatia bacterium]|nr:3-oxoacyl-[acyl-carrier-protein] reductase [Candidatus Tanganyikabacteria bacterium]